jgi:hypothetical protein
LGLTTRQENVARGNKTGRKRKVEPFCKNGHEFTPQNTYLHPKGYRVCRICKRQDAKKFSKRHRRINGKTEIREQRSQS